MMVFVLLFYPVIIVKFFNKFQIYRKIVMFGKHKIYKLSIDYLCNIKIFKFQNIK